MFDLLNIEERSRLALLGGNVDWRTTPIAQNDGILADAKKFMEPNWWKRTEPRDAEGREIIDLVRRAGLGALRIKDGQEEEQRQYGEGGTSGEEVSRHRRNKEKNLNAAGDELEPAEGESVSDWLARLAKYIDTNGSKKIVWDALRSYASRFRGDERAKKTLDARLVRAFLNAVN